MHACKEHSFAARHRGGRDRLSPPTRTTTIPTRTHHPHHRRPSVAPGCSAAIAAVTPESVSALATAYAGALANPVCAGTTAATENAQLMSLLQTPAFAQIYTLSVEQECAGTSSDGAPACIAAEFNAKFGEGYEPKHSDCAALKALNTASCTGSDAVAVSLFTANDCALLLFSEEQGGSDGPPDCIAAECVRAAAAAGQGRSPDV